MPSRTLPIPLPEHGVDADRNGAGFLARRGGNQIVVEVFTRAPGLLHGFACSVRIDAVELQEISSIATAPAEDRGLYGLLATPRGDARQGLR